MADKPCKPETMREEISEHKQLLRKPAFRKAVTGGARKATGKR